ncbi:MAG TPA: hypothetical protein VHX44_11260 [Planctomycetota bacterium]|nr:hypothetical protein [Planctomycetota bacterium]
MVADADGLVRLPQVIHLGAGVWLRLRAWPDAAARRVGELADWRQRADAPVRQAMGWLLAEPGAERRERLAALWPKLGDDPAAVVVRQFANRRGETVDGIKQVADDAIGDWLLARGRAAGQALPSPKRRSAGGDHLSARVAIAATALAEGWSEGRARWLAVRDEVVAMTDDDALVLGIACEAAGFAGEVEVGKRLAARLAQCAWTSELAAVLAVGLLPEKSERAVGPVTIRSHGTEIPMPANEFAEWSGVVDELELLGDAGAVVDLDLIVQQPLAGWADAGVVATVWQESDEGFERIPDGQPMWPGRRVLLAIENTSWERAITIALPSLLRLERQEGEVFLINGREDHWSLDWEDQGRLLQQLQDGHRSAMMSDLARVLARQVVQRAPLGLRLALASPEGGNAIHGGQMIRQSIKTGWTLFPLSVRGEGSCHWPGLCIGEFQQEERLLVVQATHELPPASRAIGHPLRAAVLANLARCSDAEVRWLLHNQAPSTLPQWQSALRTLDPQAEQTLPELLNHPGRDIKGHWTQVKIRRWIDGEPLLHADPTVVHDLIGSDEPTLESLITLAEASRDQRRQAWFALPQPQKVPAAALVNLHQWYDRLVQLGLITGGTYRTWCWQQRLSVPDLARLGYGDSIDDWAAFVRQQLDLPVRIGGGVRTASGFSVWVSLPSQDHTGRLLESEPIRRPSLGGTCLGLEGLGEELIVVELADIYELRPFLPSPTPQPAALSADYTDVPATEVFDHLNLLLSNRGLPPLRLGGGLTREDLTALPPVSLRCEDMRVENVLDFFSKIIGLKLVREHKGFVLERE